jgi:hypothetical protein
LNHFTDPDFWKHYQNLAPSVQRIANRNFQILKANPAHPSLHFMQVGRFWSVRVGLHYRALAVRDADDIIWFWIGSHAEYDELLRSR